MLSPSNRLIICKNNKHSSQINKTNHAPNQIPCQKLITRWFGLSFDNKTNSPQNLSNPRASPSEPGLDGEYEFRWSPARLFSGAAAVGEPSQPSQPRVKLLLHLHVSELLLLPLLPGHGICCLSVASVALVVMMSQLSSKSLWLLPPLLHPLSRMLLT